MAETESHRSAPEHRPQGRQSTPRRRPGNGWDPEHYRRIMSSPEVGQQLEEELAKVKPYQPPDEQMRSYFKEQYGSNACGSFTRTEQDGSQTEIRAFEFYVDPTDPKEVRGVLVDFGLRAVQAGYRQSLGPVVLPNAGYRERTSGPLSAVYFFLEKPFGK